MRFSILFLVILLFSLQPLFSQNKQDGLVMKINSSLAGSYNPIVFHEKTGSIEHVQDGLMQRIKLETIEKIIASKNSEGYNVDLLCKDEEGCITIVKKNNTTTQMNVSSFFFNNENKANSFAKNLGELIQTYKIPNEPFSITLLNTDNTIHTSEAPTDTPKEIAKTETPVKEEPSIIHMPKATPTKKEELEETNNETEKEDVKKPSKKEKTEDDEKPEPIKKTTTKKPIKKEIVEEEKTEVEMAKSEKDFCNQLNTLLQIANDKRFKEIEGAETNATSKVNESKLKLKGAKKNYLNYFNKQRAFIAELKTSSDYEALMIDFDKIQTQIENCFSANWDNTDKADSKEYENFKGDIRDVEYADTDHKINATLRIILLSDENNKSTLFIRIQ